MSDRRGGEGKAYALDCAADKLAGLMGALNFAADNPRVTEETYETLKSKYQIDEQPILRCSSLRPTASQNQQLAQVFQLVKDNKESETAPDLYVRFNSLPGDGFNSSEFYSVGCWNFLDALGTPAQASLQAAIPILASTVKDIFPQFDQYKELNCTQGTISPLRGQASLRVTGLPEKLTQPIERADLKIYKVFEADKVLSYLIGTSDSHYRLICPGVPSSELHQVFNFPSNVSATEIASDDARYLSSLANPTLECLNSVGGEKFRKKFTTVRDKPAVNYYQKTDEGALFRFGCSSAESYFTGKLNSISVTRESMAYFAQESPAGFKVHSIPCFSWARGPILQAAFFDVVGRAMTSEELKYWTAFYVDAGDASALAPGFRKELGMRMLASKGQDDPYSSLLLESISNAIRAGKSEHKFNPGLDGSEAFFEEKSYFRRLMVKQTIDSDAIKKGIYRYISKRVSETGIPDRYTFIKAFRKTMGCTLEQIGASCPSQQTFQDYTDRFYDEPSRRWYESEIILAIEARLNACAKVLGSDNLENPCFNEIKILVDNTCDIFLRDCIHDWYGKEGLRALLLGEVLDSTDAPINPYVEGWLKPNLQSLTCFMNSYTNPFVNCSFVTNQMGASVPWIDQSLNQKIRSNIVYWSEKRGVHDVGTDDGSGIFLDPGSNPIGLFLYRGNYDFKLQAGVEAAAIIQVSLKFGSYPTNTALLGFDVGPQFPNFSSMVLSDDFFDLYDEKKYYTFRFISPQEGIYEPRVKILYYPPSRLKLHQVILNVVER